ncbi:MAG: hypothetical protein E5X48_31465 [Mesorhizobium sp.]|uniref:hypothetical protein n=1 Tax=Mesorhizobium sp. TaxID=1871066 RepID=UPI001219A8C2|nr:hypothetical protein [Mesorhizobium sp.]TIQ28392.1 MAG: hypothetical protein E5X48_31465 [Mesorhizobium sp.]
MATFEEKQAILAPLIKAVILLLEDEDFIETNPGEPVLTSELFHHMCGLYPGLRVNHLYDRRENIRKRLSYMKNGHLKEADIIPDIIVHRIGAKEDNLLVVEAKRHPKTDDGDDVWKLEGMTAEGPYHYTLGVHITFQVPKKAITQAVVYSEGHIDAETTVWLKAALPLID